MNPAFAEISNQMVNEQAAVYKIRAEQFDEEEVFVRGEVFKMQMLAYDWFSVEIISELTFNILQAA